LKASQKIGAKNKKNISPSAVFVALAEEMLSRVWGVGALGEDFLKKKYSSARASLKPARAG
jgi:hypothetical protein